MNLGLFVAGDKERVAQMDVEGRREHGETWRRVTVDARGFQRPSALLPHPCLFNLVLKAIELFRLTLRWEVSAMRGGLGL